jgi:predicted thioesterase
MPKKKAKKLKRGLRKTTIRPVEFRRTIAHYDRRLPPVLSTPSMIGQMEVAAAELLQPFLPKGSMSDARVGKRLIGDGTVERAVVQPGFADRLQPKRPRKKR